MRLFARIRRRCRGVVVGKAVPSEIAFSLKHLITVGAAEASAFQIQDGPGVQMKDFVDCQGPRLAKAFPTFSTFERLLFGVDVTVVSKMVLASERLPTDITIERPLVRVGSFVDEQVVGLGELATAITTDVLASKPDPSRRRLFLQFSRGSRHLYLLSFNVCQVNIVSLRSTLSPPFRRSR